MSSIESEDCSLLSRNGTTDPGGKKSGRLDIPVSEQLESEVIALATIEGISKAEWGRKIIEEAVYGKLFILRRMAHRQPVINGMNVPNGSESQR
jgi:hypothetical protein